MLLQRSLERAVVNEKGWDTSRTGSLLLFKQEGWKNAGSFEGGTVQERRLEQ